MNSKIILAAIVLFFCSQAIRAQDTLKPIHTHFHKAHVNIDSAGVDHSSHDTHKADTVKLHKQHSVTMPKYPHNGYVAIMYGLGSPAGAYAQNQGAILGSVYSISAAFPGIISRWGIAFKFDRGTNNINADKLGNTLTSNAGFTNITCSLPYTLGHYSYSAFLTGAYITYPNKHFTIDFRVLCGFMMATVPSFTANYYDQTAGTGSLQYQGEASASAFAFDFGVEARYPVLPKLAIFLSADYLHADPSFPIVTTGAELTSTGSIVQGSGQQETAGRAFSLFNLSFGAGYVISAKKPATPKAN